MLQFGVEPLPPGSPSEGRTDDGGPRGSCGNLVPTATSSQARCRFPSDSPLCGLLCMKTKWPCGCDLHVLLKPTPPCFPLPRATSRCTTLHRAFPTGEGKGDRDVICWAAQKLSLDVELEHFFKKKKKKIPLLLWLICSLRLSWRETLCAPPECWEDEVAVIIFMQILLRSRGS